MQVSAVFLKNNLPQPISKIKISTYWVRGQNNGQAAGKGQGLCLPLVPFFLLCLEGASVPPSLLLLCPAFSATPSAPACGSKCHFLFWVLAKAPRSIDQKQVPQGTFPGTERGSEKALKTGTPDVSSTDAKGLGQ